MHPKALFPIGVVLPATGCATLPDGTSVVAYLGTGKTFAQPDRI